MDQYKLRRLLGFFLSWLVVLVLVIIVWQSGFNLLVIAGAVVITLIAWYLLSSLSDKYKCPNCGYVHSVVNDVHACAVCGKETCYKCSEMMLFKAIREDTPYDYVAVCSTRCWNAFSKSIKAWMDSNVTLEDTVDLALAGAYKSYIRDNPGYRKPYELEKLLEDSATTERIGVGGDMSVYMSTRAREREDAEKLQQSSNRFYQEITEHFDLIQQRLFEEKKKKEEEEKRKAREQEEPILLEEAKLAEKVGRYEDAARSYETLATMYEDLKLYDKAREFRNRALRLKGKGKQVVVVDLNQLIQQVKDGGIVAVYRCPRCGGKLKIDKGTSVESLKVCEYCGSDIEAMELAHFLRTALS